jgi:hypothetical protein
VTESKPETTQRSHRAPTAAGWVAGVFALLAFGFVFDLWGAVEPIAIDDSPRPSYSANETVRDPILAARIMRVSFEYGCQECHSKFDADSDRRARVAEHTGIELEHGANSRCWNCHNADNLDTLIDYEGTLVPFEHSERLCGKCHGPKYRDWKVGVHGRQNGYWAVERGESVKVTCVNCHAPHSPKFKPIAPAPGPAHPHLADKGNDHG